MNNIQVIMKMNIIDRLRNLKQDIFNHQIYFKKNDRSVIPILDSFSHHIDKKIKNECKHDYMDRVDNHERVKITYCPKCDSMFPLPRNNL